MVTLETENKVEKVTVKTNYIRSSQKASNYAPEVNVTCYILGEESKGLTTFRTVFLFI